MDPYKLLFFWIKHWEFCEIQQDVFLFWSRTFGWKWIQCSFLYWMTFNFFSPTWSVEIILFDLGFFCLFVFCHCWCFFFMHTGGEGGEGETKTSLWKRKTYSKWIHWKRHNSLHQDQDVAVHPKCQHSFKSRQLQLNRKHCSWTEHSDTIGSLSY